MTRTALAQTVSFALLTVATPQMYAAERLLSCRPFAPGPPFVLKIDLDRKTVSSDGQYGYGPREPRQAQVTDDEITWTIEGSAYNTLSRVTGHFLAVGMGTSSGGRWESECEVVTEKKF